MNVDSVFKTDILRALISKIEEFAKVPYKDQSGAASTSLPIICAVCALPLQMACNRVTSTGAMFCGKCFEELFAMVARSVSMSLFFTKFTPRLIELMGEDYPELVKSQHLHRRNFERRGRSFSSHSQKRRQSIEPNHRHLQNDREIALVVMMRLNSKTPTDFHLKRSPFLQKMPK